MATEVIIMLPERSCCLLQQLCTVVAIATREVYVMPICPPAAFDDLRRRPRAEERLLEFGVVRHKCVP